MQRRKGRKEEEEENKTEVSKEGLLVIGAGHGRTGTLSMKSALDILGLGPCYHMFENLQKDHNDLWYRIATIPRGDPKRPKWSEVFTGYRSTMDLPAALFYEELMNDNPNAKVILTLRDSESWYESVKNSIRLMAPSPYPTLGLRIWFTLVPSARHIVKMRVEILDRQFNRGDNSKESWINNYERHNEEVQRVVPKERLLIYRVGEGWEPLCKFLGRPIPNQPFPHENDTKSFQRRFMVLSVYGYILSLVILLIVFFIFYFIWLLFANK